MNEKYDIAIAYRIYPKISKMPAYFSKDKLKLAELCLFSFKDALMGLRYRVYVIMDSCPLEYKFLFEKYFNISDIEIVEVSNAGNPLTFKMQLDWLVNQSYSKNVYFAEDDYFFLGNAFSEALDFLNSKYKPDFVTMYDHLDYYTSHLHNYKVKLVLHRNRMWRKVASCCMSFLSRRETVANAYNVLLSYAKKNFDSSLWFSLTKMNLLNPSFYFANFRDELKRRIILKAYYFNFFQIFFGRRYSLYSPIPSLATHMDSEGIAPLVSWGELWEKTAKRLLLS